jgi:hypothetical protein
LCSALNQLDKNFARCLKKPGARQQNNFVKRGFSIGVSLSFESSEEPFKKISIAERNPQTPPPGGVFNSISISF